MVVFMMGWRVHQSASVVAMYGSVYSMCIAVIRMGIPVFCFVAGSGICFIGIRIDYA